MFARQTLLGGDYELVNRTTGLPNPDFVVAVLWHDLVGSGARAVAMDEQLCSRTRPGAASSTPAEAAAATDGPPCGAAVRIHAHTALADSGSGGAEPASKAAVIVILVNFAESAAFTINLTVEVVGGTPDGGLTNTTSDMGSMWQLSASPASNRIFLNGDALVLAGGGSGGGPLLPELKPVPQSAGRVLLPPSSVTFLRL
jgi:hypothetical protein